MDARTFLRALWQDVPSQEGPFIQVWSLADRKTGYYANAQGVTADGEADMFTGVGLAGKRHGPKHRAKAPEVVAIAGLWLDLDIGPGKFENRTQALSFANVVARPTITIDSGTGGVHAWYLFEQPWVFRTRSEQERARIIAQQWVALHQVKAAERFAQIDSVGDLARVLRLPGTLNTKTDPAGVVTVIEAEGPRHTYSSLAKHLTAMPIQPVRERIEAAPVAGDASQFAAKLEALLANSPEFSAVYTHQRTPGKGSLSEIDLSLCSLAAGAMNDADLALLIGQHRAQWGDANDRAKGERASYVDRTIARARSGGSAALNVLARRAA